jgi:hypothetical protein
MNHSALRVLVSAGAGVLMLTHALLPHVTIDSITLGLFIVAVLPWVAVLIKSAEFPGGWKVEFREVQDAAAQITKELVRRPATFGATTGSPETFIESTDPNLALIALRIDIEKRLRRLAEKYGEPATSSLPRIIQGLRELTVLTSDESEGLERVILAGNKAAHGASVDPQIAEHASSWGRQIVELLEQKLAGSPR